ncbi:MAG: DNA/RNA nuclease SfsA [Myxococcota bacterium]
MRFDQPLIEGTLKARSKRFVAEVELENGEAISARCANSGSMLGVSEPGSKVLLSVHDDPKRKFKHQLEIIYSGRTPVGVHTGRPSSVITEALQQGLIPELAGYAKMRREVPFNRDSKISILLEGNGLRPCYVEVLNVTLADGETALFPDALDERLLDRMVELTDLVREGNRAMIMFLAQRCDVERFRPADHIDPEFGQAFRDAVARGVETLGYRAQVTPESIEFDERLVMEIE